MLQAIRKRFALKKIFQRMPSLLVDRYGVSGAYTQGQVDRTMEVESLNTDYIDYAYAAFLNFDDAVACVGNEEMVLSIQSEVIEQYSNSNIGEVGNSGHSSIMFAAGGFGGDGGGSAGSFGGGGGGDGGGGGGGS